MTALRQDSWVFLNEIGRSGTLKIVLLASGFTGGPLRFETPRDIGDEFSIDLPMAGVFSSCVLCISLTFYSFGLARACHR